MRKVATLFAALTLPFTLTACNNQAQLDSFVKDVQKGAVAVCAFLPAVETITAIFAANAALPAATVAHAICDAVTQPSGYPTPGMMGGSDKGKAVVMVGDVEIPVKGSFVSK